ncbi:MAG: HNH endonuclease [Solirubrobacterales bacterium]
MRDEIILALDLYRREGRNPSTTSAVSLSDQLRSIPIEADLADDPQFRNPAAVKLKVANFVALDPGAETSGMSRGSRLDQEVFDEFFSDKNRLEATAAAIGVNLGSVEADPPDSIEDEGFEDAPEGKIMTRVHRYRERNRKLTKKRKEQQLQRHGTLACEACGFDFEATYGERGAGFIECHHVIPLRDLTPGSRTKLSDLALLCANCHRMIHAKADWLSVPELRARLDQQTHDQRP